MHTTLLAAARNADHAGMLVLTAFVYLIAFLVAVVVLQSVFRVNRIVRLLEEIRDGRHGVAPASRKDRTGDIVFWLVVGAVILAGIVVLATIGP